MAAKTTLKPTIRQKRDAYIPDGFRQYLRQHLPGFSDIQLAHQVALARMIAQTPVRFREHCAQPGWASFSASELAQSFGRNGFKGLNDKLGAFLIEEDWSKCEGRTKAYKLTNKLAELRAHYFTMRAKPPANLCAQNGDVRHKLPFNAVAAKMVSVNGSEMTRPTWNGRPVLSAVSVNVANLQALASFIESEISAFNDGQRTIADIDIAHATYVLSDAQLVLDAANNNLTPGCVVHRYEVSTSGRLYAKGVNLQCANRQVRFAAFAGLWDYDIENCHFDILRQMSEKAGYQCKAIADYIDHKEAFRRALADDIQITKAQVKKVLLALVYGASLAQDADAAIPEAVGGLFIANKLYQHELFQKLYRDICGARTSILDSYRDPKGKLVAHIQNACGLCMQTKGRKDRQLLAHLLQGVEAQALEAVHNLYATDILLLQHDGITAPSNTLDMAAMEKAIQNKTGYHLRIAIDGPIQADYKAVLLNLDKISLPIQKTLIPNVYAAL